MINKKRYIRRYLERKKSIAISLHSRALGSEKYLKEYVTSLKKFWRGLYILYDTDYWNGIDNLLVVNKEWAILQNIKFPCMLDEIGDMIEIFDFIELCHKRMFIDYDGYGYVSNGKYKSRYQVRPSQITNNSITIDNNVSHVLWYNR